MGRLPPAILVCILFFPFSPLLPMSASVVVKVLIFVGARGGGIGELNITEEKKAIINENK